MDSNSEEVIRLIAHELPKTELHLHLDGSLSGISQIIILPWFHFADIIIRTTHFYSSFFFLTFIHFDSLTPLFFNFTFFSKLLVLLISSPLIFLEDFIRERSKKYGIGMRKIKK